MLLDRPDEFLSGVGFDYSVNKHFQLIGEARSTMYVAGKTPNAFNNNPVEAIGGVRIYPARWWGLGFAYRRHMNQQDAGHFNQADFNTGGSKPEWSICTWAGALLSCRARPYRRRPVERPTASSSRTTRMGSFSNSGLVTATLVSRQSRQIYRLRFRRFRRRVLR